MSRGLKKLTLEYRAADDPVQFRSLLTAQVQLEEFDVSFYSTVPLISVDAMDATAELGPA